MAPPANIPAIGAPPQTPSGECIPPSPPLQRADSAEAANSPRPAIGEAPRLDSFFPIVRAFCLNFAASAMATSAEPGRGDAASASSLPVSADLPLPPSARFGGFGGTRSPGRRRHA